LSIRELEKLNMIEISMNISIGIGWKGNLNKKSSTTRKRNTKRTVILIVLARKILL